LSTDEVTFAVNGRRDQPFCGMMLTDRAVSRAVGELPSRYRWHNTDHQETSGDQQILLTGRTELCN